MKKIYNKNFSFRNTNKINLISKIQNGPKFVNFFLNKLYTFLKKNNFNINKTYGSEVFENSFFKSNLLLSVLKVHLYKKFLTNKYFLSNYNVLTFNEKLLLNTKNNNRFLTVKYFFEDKVNTILLFIKILIFKVFSPQNTNNKKEKSNSLLFVSYVPQSNFFLNQNNFKSYHWNDLPYILGKNIKINYLHLYPLNKEILDLLIRNKFCSSKIKKSVSNHFFFLNFISYKSIFIIFMKSILRFVVTKKKNDLDFYFCKAFSSSSYFESMLWKKLFYNFFRVHNSFKKSFYLFENQPWEKYFYYYHNFFVSSKIYAYNHSVCRKMDYRVYTSIFFSKKQSYKKYFPSEILVNDVISFKNIKSFDQSFKIVKVESTEKKLKINIADNNKVLVLGDISITNSVKIINIAIQLKKNKIINDFVFKPHPSNENFFIQKYTKICFFLNELDRYRKKIQYIFCTNSTAAAVRFAETGINIFVFIPNNNINLSPLNGYYNSIFFNNYESLLNLLNNKQKLRKENIYYRNIKMKRWKNLK